MPILWHSSFNGMDQFFYGKNTQLSTANSGVTPTFLSSDNVINRVFGKGLDAVGGLNTGNAPIIVGKGMKASPTASYAASCGLGVGRSSFDPASNALIGSFINGSNDYRFGVTFDIRHMLSSSSASWRIGFRIGCPANYQGQTSYPSQIGPVDMAHNGDRTAQYSWANTTDFVGNKGREFYIEVEWLTSLNRIDIYKDDVLWVTSPKTGGYPMGGGGITVSHIFYSAPVGNNTMFEMRDIYIQEISSDSDVRLGSSTSVRAVQLLADDVVEFDRPAGYETNASVAGLPLRSLGVSTSEPGNTALLGATSVGSSDRYTLDAAALASSLSAIEAVQVRTMASNRGTGTRLFGAIAESGGVLHEAETPSSAPASQASTFNTIQMTSDPNDGQRWSLAKIGALKVGTKLYP